MLTNRIQIILLNISGCYTGNKSALTVYVFLNIIPNMNSNKTKILTHICFVAPFGS